MVVESKCLETSLPGENTRTRERSLRQAAAQGMTMPKTESANFEKFADSVFPLRRQEATICHISYQTLHIKYGK
jgi:hypothetical protein